MWTFNPQPHHAFMLVSVLLLAACSSLPADPGRQEITNLIGERGLLLPPVDDNLPPLSGSITESGAVQYALLNNPDLEALYQQLGFAAAAVYDAGRIRNPVFSASLLDPARSGLDNQLTLGFTASFTDMVTMPARKRMAKAEFAAARQTFAAAVLDLAADTRAAYYDDVAAQQRARLREQASKVSSLSLALAERFFAAGNISPKAMALKRAAAAQDELLAIEADVARFETRSRLAALLDVPIDDPWKVDAQLPLPPADDYTVDDLVTLAWASRLDLSAAKIRAEYLADQLDVTGWRRWLEELTLGYERELDTDGEVLKGPTLEWELPVFSSGRGDLLRAESELNIQIVMLRTLALDIGNQVRLANERMQNQQRQVALYRDRLIPALVEATRQTQAEQNFMLIGIFELLETKQEEFDAYEGYVEAVHGYWLARIELGRAVGNTLPGDANIGKAFLDIDAFPERATMQMDHPMPEKEHSHH